MTTTTENPMTPEQCREGARKMAEWMGWFLFNGYNALGTHVYYNTKESDRQIRFDPYRSRDDLAPVLAEIAKRGLWHEFMAALGTTLNVKFFSYPSDFQKAILATPHVLASAALATIEGEEKK